MANSLFLLHSCTPRNPNRLLPNLPLIVVTTVFCTVFYLIGLWQHSYGPVAIDAGYVVADSLCLLPNSTSSSPSPPPPPNLDFTARHYIPDPLPAPKAARDFHFPLCDVSLSEYTPCEDVNRSLKFDRDRLIYRERHCPEPAEVLRCRIPAPYGYRVPVRWPESRDWVWYANVPHKELTVEKKQQNWIRFEGERFRFPGGGTMFPRGADAYVDDIGKLINLRDGSIRTAIDTGCGVSIVLRFLSYVLSRESGSRSNRFLIPLFLFDCDWLISYVPCISFPTLYRFTREFPSLLLHVITFISARAGSFSWVTGFEHLLFKFLVLTLLKSHLLTGEGFI